MRQRRGMSRKTVSPPGATILLYPPSQLRRASPRHRVIPAAHRAVTAGVSPQVVGRTRSQLSEAAGRGLSHALQTPTTSPAPEPVAPALDGHSQSFGRVLTIVGGDCALLEHAGTIQLLSLPVAERWLRQAQLTPGQSPVCAQPLLIPLRLKVSADEKAALQKPNLCWENWVLNFSQMRSM